jgi:aminoglycoside 3-N-acetyltransferase
VESAEAEKRCLTPVQGIIDTTLAAGDFGTMQSSEPQFYTRASLRGDLVRLGVHPGDMVMAHAAMRRVGPLLNGPDALISALLDAIGPAGTLMAYVDWDARYDELLDEEGRVPAEWREHIPPFDAASSRAIRDNGALAEFVRTTPGARRSGNPGASVAAIGAQAEWLTANHPLDYGYGEGSPFAKLIEAGGKVLMVGAPLDTMTLLHHAEHLARIPNKRVRRYEVPFAAPSGVQWRLVEEFDTSDPVVEGLAEDYFAIVVSEFLDSGQGKRGFIGSAPSVLVDAASICAFAVDWLERNAGS